MKKTLYSLTLSDEVVREIDLLAHRRGMSRSWLINEILAEYVQVMTPQRWVSEVFRSVEELLAPSRELVPFFVPNASSMSMKSSLAYKYRPTVKYEVELRRTGNGGDGTLSVIFRTQSEELIQEMTQFFRLWKQFEDRRFARLGLPGRVYELYPGRFVRSIVLDGAQADTAEGIAGYVQCFDRLMKLWLAGQASPEELEQAYEREMTQLGVTL